MTEENKDNVAEADVQTEAAQEEAPEMSHRDENWELVTFLNIPWFDADKLDGEDRGYLLKKAEEVKLEVLRRRKAEVEEMERRKKEAEQQQAMQMQQMQMQMQQPQVPQQPQQWQQGPPQWGTPQPQMQQPPEQ